jgi:hypothetical protein
MSGLLPVDGTLQTYNCPAINFTLKVPFLLTQWDTRNAIYRFEKTVNNSEFIWVAESS